MMPYMTSLGLQTGMFSATYRQDMDGLIECVIHFCADNYVPTWKVCCFPNNEPWMTTDLKALLDDKKEQEAQSEECPEGVEGADQGGVREPSGTRWRTSCSRTGRGTSGSG